jgi:cob(I)alamin adenosyltransferase
LRSGKEVVVARPQIRRVPRVGAATDSRLLSKTDELAKMIVTATGTIQEVVINIQEALTYSDAKRLQQYLREIEHMEARVKAVLASPELGAGK